MNHVIKNDPDSEPEEMDTQGADDATIKAKDVKMIESDEVAYENQVNAVVNGREVNAVSKNCDEPMEEDEARSEATFSFTVQSISRLKDTVLSPPTFVRNLPWKIMCMLRTSQNQERQVTKSLGFFLQCNAESESTSWSCNASAELRLINNADTEKTFQRKIQHLFYSKENDWGFSHFVPWSDVLDTDKGYVKDDTITLEVSVSADAPHGVSWDSKKHTGYVGLKNQGATCYMNSLLQTLFFTNKLREAVYLMPTENDDTMKSVAFALQQVFYELEFSDKPVGTKKLTKSFGWETLDSFMQHDVQELCRTEMELWHAELLKELTPEPCPFVDNNKADERHQTKCKVCRRWGDHVKEMHIKPRDIYWKNSDCQRWQSDPWQIAKLKNEQDFTVLHAKDYHILFKMAKEHGRRLEELEAGQDMDKEIQWLNDIVTCMKDELGSSKDEWASSKDDIANLEKVVEQLRQSVKIFEDRFVESQRDKKPTGRTLLFMNSGQWKVGGPDETDESGLLNLIKNCTRFDDLVNSKLTRKNFPFKMLEIRNCVYHNRDRDVSEEDLKQNFINMTEFVKDIRKTGKKANADPVVQALKQVRSLLLLYLQSYVNCKHVEYMSSRVEPFYDIQLNVKGKRNIHESFKDYVAIEVFEGDNKYDAGEHGLQDAEKGVWFKSFPPVLHLQLMRFQYDPVTDTNIKINDRFEFPEKLNLDKFLQTAEPTAASYTLHAVLVHSGANHGGHYVVYINPKGDGKWCKFDDDVVSRCTKQEAMENNFGGHEEDVSVKRCTNAYMLVYVRDSSLGELLQTVTENDIPTTLVDRLQEEKKQEAIRRKERSEAHLFMTILVLLEDDFNGHQGNDLYDSDRAHSRTFRVKKMTTLDEAMDLLAENMKIPRQQMRPWPFNVRTNQTFRPTKELVLYPNKNGSVGSLLKKAENFVEWTEDGSGKLRLVEVVSNKVFCIQRDDVQLECLNTGGTKSYRVEEVPKEELIIGDDEMLVHVAHFQKVKRREGEAELLQTVTENDIPMTLVDRLQEEKKQEAIRRKERSEAHLFMTILVLLNDDFNGHQGNDLYDSDRAHSRTFRVKKMTTLDEAMDLLAENMKIPRQQMRPWPFNVRPNQTFRPTVLEVEQEAHKTIQDLAETDSSWTIFLETLSVDSGLTRLPVFDKERDVLLFLKMYDPKTKSINYCGYIYAAITTIVSDILPVLNERAGFPRDTPLILYEEVKPNFMERMENYDLALEKIFDELMDGDIIVFQKDDPNMDTYDLPTAKDYFRDLYYRVEVTFRDKSIPSDPGFTLDLSQRMNYEQVVRAVAQKLNTDPYLLQFFKSQGFRDGPGNPLRCNYEGTLKDLLVYFKPRQQKKLYYQRLSIKITELENKKQFKCTFVNSNLKEEKELVLYPNKNGSVGSLLKKAENFVEWTEDGSGKLRLVEVVSNKVFCIHRDDVQLECLITDGTKSYRVEEVPKEELTIGDDEMLVHVAHFQKEVFSTFGLPFLFKIKNKEPFAKVKERMQKKLELTDKDTEKMKFALVVMGRPNYFPDDGEYNINLEDFLPNSSQTGGGGAIQTRPWIGIDHVIKVPKRARHPYLEKPIKIHN
ncbi:PREDICTED: ubiquitin carboxyl-terminal hydrolase 7-like [Priapulus caudatus]|uniref:Ubiquitin carboxyl-terminal hydrolase 7 n=1 Tax=Priapulus caudatus TaxID=37621 RepID=A0ABM1F9T3_PRICU|nr:PREDICTED: ubiquitin carboxyl-terminal hydrolase 7-like [Priapulus caudatus]